ncbi:MAG: efflux RND transporter permease subunit [Candidatus Eremiobacteraeota bacterium]|nr:efflux RND transporter permease subunit [Candidatus Eremiobacteraeota bacterium]MCW5872103.1 efflux RND transporter permease subunit [Candidatus Eremiobacteraeota bacterium]
MLAWLIEGSLQLRLLVVTAALGIIGLGVNAVRHSKMDVFPEFAPPRVEVQTEAPGLSTEEVERLVSIPIENALTSTPFVATLRSKSVLGLSSVLLVLEPGANLEVARQNVQERLAQATLPTAARPPVILPPLSSTSRILKVGISSKTLSQMEMSESARWVIRPRLMAIPGVANVAIWGQRDRQFQVAVSPRQLAAQNVTLEEVVLGVGNAVSVGGGGFIDTPNQRLPIRHESWAHTTEDLDRAVVANRNGVSLRVRDIGTVQIGSPPPIGDAVINGRPGLLLIVEKYPWGNTLEVTRGVEKALEELRPGLPAMEIDTTIFRPATFIETALANLSSALWMGCGLVVVVLIVFLADLPSALISALAIPVSLLSAVLIIVNLGYSVNTMVIAGLAISLGAVVDDAIIDVENITRRLRLNAAAEHPQPVGRVILQASLEVRSSIVYATAIVIVAILPVFFLEGIARAFFSPLAFAYVLAILVSLLVALTLTPALCLMLLRVKPGAHAPSPVSRWLQKSYGNILRKTMYRPRIWLALVTSCLIGTGMVVPRFGQEFLPHFKETDFLMHFVEKPGTSLEAMRRITARASDELMSIPGVRNFGSHIGRAVAADEVVGPNFTELWISIDPKVDYESTVKRIQEVIAGYPGLHRDVLTYLRERIKEVLSGTSASIVVRISGPELDGLRASAQGVAKALADVPGVSELKVEAQVLVPQISIKMRPERAALHGFSERDLRRAESIVINGLKVGEIYEGQAIHEVVVWSQSRVRDDLSALRELLVETPAGNRVPLREVADITMVPAPNTIRREGASRCIDVSCNVEGRDLGSVARDIREKLKSYPFESGYYPQTFGEFEAQEAARGRLSALSLLALLTILVLLQSDFQSLRLVAVVFLSLPFSLIGGVAGIAAGGGVISLGSVVGFVAVLGIAARNGIMLVSHYRHLQQDEGCPFGPELVLRGAQERLVPILMTALTAMLALVPIALGGNLPGYEIEYPMALVILGGMFSSTGLSLFLLPAFYLWLGKGLTKS